MPSKQHRPDLGADEKTSSSPKPTSKQAMPTASVSQEHLRNELPLTESEGSSFLLGVVNEGIDQGAGVRGDSFKVGGKTISSDLGKNTSFAGQTSGSGRGDSFEVAGKAISSDLGKNTSFAGQTSGSGRGDSFKVEGKTISSDLGKNTSFAGQTSGSGRGDKFDVSGKSISSDLGKNTSFAGQTSGSGRGDKFDVKGKSTSSDLGKNTSFAGQTSGSGRTGKDIPGLNPVEGKNVSVSLPLMEATATLDANEKLSPELETAAVKAVAQHASLIHPEDIPAGLLGALPANTILRLAFSPEDMGRLDLEAEHASVSAVADVLTLNNPTVETMKYVLESGQFEDVIWSGHGSKDGLWITGEDGKAKKLLADDVAAMFKDSGVKEMLLNVCDGGAEVDDAIALTGINTFSHDREIVDEEAISDATQFADSGSLWEIDGGGGRDGGRVTTQRRAQHAKRRAEMTEMFESWKASSDQSKQPKGGLWKSFIASLKSGGSDKAGGSPWDVFSGFKMPGPKEAVKRLGRLGGGNKRKRAQRRKRMMKRRRSRRTARMGSRRRS